MPKRLGWKKNGSQYEDLDDHNVGPNSSGIPGGDVLTEPEIELTSVSVIPDGKSAVCNANCANYHFPYLSLSICFADTFTVTQAVNAFGFGKFQVKLSFFTGLCWMADSMEMTILSILSPALHCSWHITRYQQALTTTVREFT